MGVRQQGMVAGAGRQGSIFGNRQATTALPGNNQTNACTNARPMPAPKYATGACSTAHKAVPALRHSAVHVQYLRSTSTPARTWYHSSSRPPSSSRCTMSRVVLLLSLPPFSLGSTKVLRPTWVTGPALLAATSRIMWDTGEGAQEGGTGSGAKQRRTEAGGSGR